MNIEGLVAGYTGPGGKTVLPHRAVAKLDLRLVPDMKFDDAVAALKAHLARRGFGDIEVNVTGGYDPTSTPASAPLIQAQVTVLKKRGIDPVLWPRNAGSYPGYVFTGAPLNLASGHFGLGHGGGAPGMNGDLRIYPQSGYVIAVLSNLDPLAANRVSQFVGDRLPIERGTHDD